MKFKKIFFFTVIFSIGLISCSKLNYNDVKSIENNCRIYLYGERHGQQRIIEKELELWTDYYNKQNFRHLFIESGYADTVLLNIWLKEDNDDILDLMFENLGKDKTLSHTDADYIFYKKVKETCPETIFHGTDVEHQFDSTGEYCLSLLKEKGLENSLEYKLAEESIEQAYKYYSVRGGDDVYRENIMVSNFEREFDALTASEKIMGIYGAQHTRFNSKDFSNQVDNMATQLNAHYSKKEGKIIYSLDISKL